MILNAKYVVISVGTGGMNAFIDEDVNLDWVREKHKRWMWTLLFYYYTTCIFVNLYSTTK